MARKCGLKTYISKTVKNCANKNYKQQLKNVHPKDLLDLGQCKPTDVFKDTNRGVVGSTVATSYPTINEDYNLGTL